MSKNVVGRALSKTRGLISTRRDLLEEALC